MKFCLLVASFALLHRAHAVDWGFRQQQRKTELAYGYEVAGGPDCSNDPTAAELGPWPVIYNGYSVKVKPDGGVEFTPQHGDPTRPGLPKNDRPLLEFRTPTGSCGSSSVEFKVIQNIKSTDDSGIIPNDSTGTLSHINIEWPVCNTGSAYPCWPKTELETTKYESDLPFGNAYGWLEGCCDPDSKDIVIKVQFNDGQFQTKEYFDVCNENFPDTGGGKKVKNAEYHFVVDCNPVTTPSPTPGVTTPSPTPGVTTPSPTPGVTTPSPTPGVTTPSPTPKPTGDCVQPDSGRDQDCEMIFPLGSDTKENDPMLDGADVFFNLKRVVESDERDGLVGVDDVSLEFSINNFYDDFPADIWVEYLSIVEEDGVFVKKQICNSTMDEPYCPKPSDTRQIKIFKAACVFPYNSPPVTESEWWPYTGINVIYRSPGATKIEEPVPQEQEVPCCCRRDSDIDRSDAENASPYSPAQWVYVKYSYALLCGCPSESQKDDLQIYPLAHHHHVDRDLEEGEEDEEDGKDDCDEEGGGDGAGAATP